MSIQTLPEMSAGALTLAAAPGLPLHAMPVVEGLRELAQSIETRAWVDAAIAHAVGGLSTAMDLLDPFVTVARVLIPYVQPIQDLITWLAGDPSRLLGDAHAYYAAADELERIGGDLHRGAMPPEWAGSAAVAFRDGQALPDAATVLGAAAAVRAIGGAYEGCARICAGVRPEVEAVAAELVGRVSEAVVVALVTVGVGTAVVVARLTAWLARFFRAAARIVRAVCRSRAGLATHVDEVGDLLAPLRHGRGPRTGPGSQAAHIVPPHARNDFDRPPVLAESRGPEFPHEIGRQVPYSGVDSDLVRQVHGQRLADGPGDGRRGNYGAARLEDGTVLSARSSRDLHAEEQLLRDAGDRRIVELYTERAPCVTYCQPKLRDSGIDTTWSFPWNHADRVERAAIRQTSTAELTDAVDALFRAE